MCGDITGEHSSWHLESRWTTQWRGPSKQRKIEMEMWCCLRCTVGMTGVSSPHLPVAVPEIRKPSNVFCYTHLNGSCIYEPWIAACGLGCILCVCGCVANKVEQGDRACAQRISIVLYTYPEEMKVQALASGKYGKHFYTLIYAKVKGKIFFIQCRMYFGGLWWA